MKRIGWWIGFGLGGSLMAQVWHSPVAAQTPPIWIGSPPTSQVSTTIAGLTPNSAAAAAFNSSLVNAAIQNIATLGGGQLVIPCGNYYVAGVIDNNVQNVMVSGSARVPQWQFPTVNGPLSPAPSYCVTLTATTANNILQHRTPHSPTTPVFMGGGFQDIQVNGAGIGLVALYVDDVSYGTYRVGAVNMAGAQAVQVTTGVSNTDCNGPCYIHHSVFDLTVDQRGTATEGLVLNSSSNADSAFSDFTLRAYMGTGIALDAQSDNNTFDIYWQQQSNQMGILMRCPSAGHGAGGGYNRFRHISGGGGSSSIYAQGTGDSGCTGSAGGLKVEWLDHLNQTPIPTAGTGAYWDFWQDDTGWVLGAASFSTGLTTGSGGNLITLGEGNPGYVVAPYVYGNTLVYSPLLVQAGTGTTAGATLRVNNTVGVCNHTAGTSSETVSCSSDASLKADIVDAAPALDWLNGYHIRDYTVKADGSKATGVIAQEVRTAHPEAVHAGDDGKLTVDQPNPWKLVKAIQELQDALRQARDEIDALKAAHH